MALVELDPKGRAILWQVSSRYADHYVGEILLNAVGKAIDCAQPTLPQVREALGDPILCLRVFFSHYAFSRRGKDRALLATMAIDALDRCLESDPGSIIAGHSGEALWNAYLEVTAEHNRQPTVQLDLGVIAGMAELCQEIYQEDGVGSIASWIVRSILQTDRIEPAFLRMVDIRGVGPKTTSTFLRDIVFVSGLEDQLDHQDRLYVQPIDKWMRMMAPYIIPEIVDIRAADWILAGKISKYARHAGVSGIRFNMGTTYFGLRVVHEPDAFEPRIKELLSA